MKKLKSKKKKLSKNPILKWLCFYCHHHKSSKAMGRVVKAFNLTCSLCDEFLEYQEFTAAGGVDKTAAQCPSCSNSLAIPVCLDCGNKLSPFDDTLKTLEKNPIENELPIEVKKKKWWEL